MSTVRRVAGDLGLAALAGVLSGIVVGGLLGRLAMRVSGAMSAPELIGVSTAAGNRVGDITLAGTLALVVFVGLPSGLAGGVLYRLVEPWLAVFGARRRGLVFGLGLLLVFGFTVLEPFNFDFRRFGAAPLNVALFAVLFPAFGVSLVWTLDRLEAAAKRPGRRAVVVRVAGWVLLVPALLTIALVVDTVRNLADPLYAAALVLGFGLPWLLRRRDLALRFAYAALSLPLLVGGWRVASGLPYLLGP